MPKITMIGAGSAVFAKNLLGDILQFPELTECHVSLMDIDDARLQTSERMAHKLAEALDVNPTIEATDDAERGRGDMREAPLCGDHSSLACYKAPNTPFQANRRTLGLTTCRPRAYI